MGQFSYLRRIIRQHEAAVLQREMVAACSRPAVLLGLHSALEAAEGLFLASIISTFLWSLLIFTVARWH